MGLDCNTQALGHPPPILPLPSENPSCGQASHSTLGIMASRTLSQMGSSYMEAPSFHLCCPLPSAHALQPWAWKPGSFITSYHSQG